MTPEPKNLTALADEIEYPPPRPPVRNIPGGAGLYSALGARLFSPPPVQSRSVGWIIDRGLDFPEPMTRQIESWATTAVFRDDAKRLTTRAWIGFSGPDEHPSFRFLTPKKCITARDLDGTPLLRARAFHLICSPARCRELVTDLVAARRQWVEERRKAAREARARRRRGRKQAVEVVEVGTQGCDSDGDDGFVDVDEGDDGDTYESHDDDDGDDDDDEGEDIPDLEKPLFIWEPVPDLCVPDELLNCTNVLPLIDVVSPNHAELAGFLGSDGLDPETGEISTAAVEQGCEQLLGSMPLQSYTLVVRCGEKGCYVARNGGRKKRSGMRKPQQQRQPQQQQQQQQQQQAEQRGVKRKQKRQSIAGAYHPKQQLQQQQQHQQQHRPQVARHIHGGLRPDLDMTLLLSGLMQDDEGFVAREEIEVDPGVERWLPAYHQGRPDMVVDPTGGGNTFLGGLGAALARGKTVEEACVWGSVAASFAIEQVGVPVLERDEVAGGTETWNGVRVEERLADYQSRLIGGL